MDIKSVNMILEMEYNNACKTKTDIHLHLPTLREYASKCSSVIELGVRDGQSTRAFLVEDVSLKSIDIYMDNNVKMLFEVAKQNKLRSLEYMIANDLEIELPEVDMIFIDTDHTYNQLSAELKLHGNKARKYLAFHDTAEPFVSETMPAILEFLVNNPNWRVCHHNKDCHGLTVLARI